MPQNTGLALFGAINDAILAVFGEPEEFTLTKDTATVVTAKGVFDGRHYLIESEGDAGVTEYMTTLACKRADVMPVPIDSTVVVRSTTYLVKDVRPDSEGWVVLQLWKQ